MDSHPLELAYTREFPGEVAAFLATRGDDAVAQALDHLPAEHAAALVARLPQGHAVRVLAARDDEHVAGWLNAASADHALSLLLHLDAARRAGVLALLPDRRTRRTLRRLLDYPDTAVGALVDPTATRLNAAMPLIEAVAILRVDTPGSEQSIWLVNDDGSYVGRLDLCQVLIAPSAKLRLDELLIPVRPLRADVTLANARDFREWQKYLELPVVDHRDYMLGTLSRARLLSGLAAGKPVANGLSTVSDVMQQYFRVLGLCLGDLFGRQGRSR